MFENLLKPAAHQPRLPEDRIDATYKRERLKVFIGIFIGYAGYYLIRKNFSLATINLEAQGYSKADLGWALSAITISYGLSKFLMGNISDRSNARNFLTIGLVLSAITMIVMGTVPIATSSIVIIFIMLFLNGWFQGMGWPPCGRVMVHWYSTKERGTLMSIWNCAHNVGAGIMAPAAILGVEIFADWHAKLYFPGLLALIFALITYILVRDTPQSCGLPPIEAYKNDYPKDYSEKNEEELSARDIFFKYVFNNKMLWYIAFANAFVYFIRYGILDWSPTFLTHVKGFTESQVSFAYAYFEIAGIAGTIICGFVSDKIFKGRRAPATIIYMILILIAVFVYWKNPKGNIMIDNIALMAIGFLIYGPVMLIGVQALDLAPKKAAGTAAGLTGFFGNLIGGAILANIVMGYVVQYFDWDGGFLMLIVSCVLTIFFTALTWNKEKEILGLAKK